MNNPFLNAIGQKPAPKPVQPPRRVNPITELSQGPERARKQSEANRRQREASARKQQAAIIRRGGGPASQQALAAKNLDELPMIMARVDRQLGTRMGDPKREAVKAYLYGAREVNQDQRSLEEIAAEALQILETRGVEYLEAGRQAIRNVRAAQQGVVPESLQTQPSPFTRAQAAQSLGMQQEGVLPPEAQRELDRRVDRVPFMRGAREALGIDEAFANAGRSIAQDWADQGRLSDLANMGDAEMIARTLYTTAPVVGEAGTTFIRSRQGKSTAEMDAGELASGIGLDLVGALAAAGATGGASAAAISPRLAALASRAPALGGIINRAPGVGRALGTFVALDAPSYAVMVADAGGNVGQAASNLAQATFGQLPKLAEWNNLSDRERVEVGFGAIMTPLLALGAADLAARGIRGAKSVVNKTTQNLATSGMTKLMMGEPINRAETVALRRVSTALMDTEIGGVARNPEAVRVMVDDLVARGVDPDTAADVAVTAEAMERVVNQAGAAPTGTAAMPEGMARQMAEQSVPVRQEPGAGVDVAEQNVTRILNNPEFQQVSQAINDLYARMIDATTMPEGMARQMAEQSVPVRQEPEVSTTRPVSDTGNRPQPGEPNATIQEETPTATQGVLGREEPQPQEQMGLQQARPRTGGEGPQAEAQAQVTPRTYESLMEEANNLRGLERVAKIKEARAFRIEEAARGGRMEGASGLNPADLQEFVNMARGYIEAGVDWVRGLRDDFGQEAEPYIESIQRQLDEEGIQVRQAGEEAPKARERRPQGTRRVDRAQEARQGRVPTKGKGRPKKKVSEPESGFVGSNVATYDALKDKNPGIPEYTSKGTPAKAAFESAKRQGMLERADEIASDIIAKGRAATNEEEVTLAHRMSVLEGELEKAKADYEKLIETDPLGAETALARVNELNAKLNNILYASRVAGTAWHNTGMARQLFMRTMNGVTALKFRAMSALKRPLTVEESGKLTAIGEQLKAAEKKIADLEKEVVRLGAGAVLQARATRRGAMITRERAVQALGELGAFEPVVGAVPVLSPKQVQAWKDLITYASQQVKNPSIDNVTRYVRDIANQNKIEMVPDEVLVQLALEDVKVRGAGAEEAFAPERARLVVAKEVIDEAGESFDMGAAVLEVVRRGGGTELEAATAIKKALGTKRGVQSRRLREVFGGEEEIARLAKQFPELAKAYADLRRERIHIQRLSEEAGVYIGKLERDQMWQNSQLLQKLWIGTKESVAVTRTVLTTLDNSIPLRQGFVVLAREPKVWTKGFFNSFRSFKNASYEQVMDAVLNKDPEIVDIGLAGGLEIPGYKGAVQEDYSSHLIQNTVLGKPFRWSQRAADASMATMRLELLGNMVRGMEANGSPLTMAEIKEICQHINVITGRGDVGKHADALSIAFLAPRYAKARVDLIFGGFQMLSRREGMTPRVKREVGSSLARYYAVVSTAVAAAMLAGAEVETDSRSADFLKAKFKTPNGEIVIDLSGGGATYVVMVTRLLLSTVNLTGTQFETDKTPDEMKTRWFFEQGLREYVKRAAPVPGALLVGGGALRDRGDTPRNVVSQPTDLGRELARTTMPIQVMSVFQNMREGGQPSEIALSFGLEWFGIGANFRGDLGEKMSMMGTYDVDPIEDIRKAVTGEPRPLKPRPPKDNKEDKPKANSGKPVEPAAGKVVPAN